MTIGITICGFTWSHALSAQQGTAAILGQLVNQLTRAPVEGARISLSGSRTVVATDSAGRFRLSNLTGGRRLLQARAIGYVFTTWLIQLPEGSQVEHVFEIESRPVELSAVVVGGRNNDWRSVDAFEQRRQRGNGHFITREEIESRGAAVLTDLLRAVPGVLTSCNSRGCTVRMGRSTRACAPEYFLDGFPATFASGPNFPIRAIQGIEIYRSATDTPVEFQRPNLQCGVIAIWTRMER